MFPSLTGEFFTPVYTVGFHTQCCSSVTSETKQNKSLTFLHHFYVSKAWKNQTQPETSLVLTAALS